ncbi:MAG: flavin reductase family protein [Promethearchaeota archaeon]
MMKDLKKYQNAEKSKKQREQTLPIPWYYDGLESLCDRLHPEKQILRLTDVKELSWDTKLFRFTSANPKKLLAPFRAGQYIGLTTEINGVRTSRPYSLVSSPNNLAYYEFGIKKKEGGFVSNYLLENLKVGDILEATGPLGEFYYNQLFHGKNLVFIAGGCGITPFISMLRDITERILPINVWVIFGCLSEKDILFREELEDIAERRSNVKLKYILSEPEPDWKGACGFIIKNEISDFIGSIEDKYFYVVGSLNMYQFIEGELNALNNPIHRRKYEAFGVPDDITKIMGWPDDIDGSKKVKIIVDFLSQGQKEQISFEALSIEPLLNSVERQKDLRLAIDNGCRSGQCALCRTKMVSGKVFVPPEVTMREIDQNYGFIHPCISYPLTDIHLDLTLT